MPVAKVNLEYSFDELSEEAKQKAIEKLYDINVDYEWWDFLFEDFANIADILGIDLRQKKVFQMDGGMRYEPSICFSGFSSQGDGAQFEGSYSYVKDSCKRIREYASQDEELHRIADILRKEQRKNFYQVYASVTPHGHYSHEHCTRIDVERKDGLTLTEGTEDCIKDTLRDFMRWMYKRLEEEYYWLTSEEQIIETIKANDYRFDREGRLV